MACCRTALQARGPLLKEREPLGCWRGGEGAAATARSVTATAAAVAAGVEGLRIKLGASLAKPLRALNAMCGCAQGASCGCKIRPQADIAAAQNLAASRQDEGVRFAIWTTRWGCCWTCTGREWWILVAAQGVGSDGPMIGRNPMLRRC